MTDILDVKTKKAAEVAIAEGKPIRIVGGKFALAVASVTGLHVDIAKTAQVELTLTDVVGRVSQEDYYSSSVVARGSSSVEAWESSRVVARESSSVVARESSSVVARESSRVEAWGSSRVEARESSSVVARGSSSVEARESSRVEAWGSSRVVARESSSVVARESSRVEAWGSSRVEAWESSRVEARESSRVEAGGSSRVEAWGSSRVEAWGYSMLQARGRYVTAKAAATVCVNLWEDAKCDGGRQQVIEMTTPQNWCDYYGVRVEDGCAIVYKAVGEGYVSHWGVAYKPGTMPTDDKWDGRKRECSAGGGLNFSPTVDHTHEFVREPKHYLECRIRLDDMVVHFGGSYPQKCCAREVVAPLIEVDRGGKAITA